MPSPRVIFNKWSRKLHRWGTVVVVLPFAIVVVTGLLLQIKKQWSWVQPPSARSETPGLGIGFDEILESARSVPEAGIGSWADVDRVDIRPGRGIAKVRSETRWEIQVDTATGEVLSSAYRRSDLIESIHDGSFFGTWAKYGVFLPSGLVIFGMLGTGVVLWWMPHGARRQKIRAQKPPAGPSGDAAGSTIVDEQPKA